MGDATDRPAIHRGRRPMTDEKQGEPEFLDKPRLVLWPCEMGHAHFVVARNDGSPAIAFVMTRDEATALAVGLMSTVREIDRTLKNLPGIAGGDAGKCERPN